MDCNTLGILKDSNKPLKRIIKDSQNGLDWKGHKIKPHFHGYGHLALAQVTNLSSSAP